MRYKKIVDMVALILLAGFIVLGIPALLLFILSSFADVRRVYSLMNSVLNCTLMGLLGIVLLSSLYKWLRKY